MPEMSREAYMVAIDQGADGFETDLRLTQDGHIVCWHDGDMKRVADCDLVIAESTLEEIRAAYPVLTLNELLDIAIAHSKHLALETKHPVPSHGEIEKALLKTLDDYRGRIHDAGIEVSIMSFSWFAITRLRRSGWNTVYLAPSKWFFLWSTGRSIGPSVKALAKMRKRESRQRQIFVWTANSESEILLCKEMGASAMMTDRPGFARAILQNG
jgi:glycerophosphoryl diester phosphodiesterase